MSMQDAHRRAALFRRVSTLTPHVRNCCKHEALCATPGIHIRALAIVRALPHQADAHDHRDLDNSIQIGSENGRRYLVFGFSQVMASEQLVEDVTAQLLKNGFGVERLLSDSEQHYIRISWDTAEPRRLNAG
jgi:hypothetical protein